MGHANSFVPVALRYLSRRSRSLAQIKAFLLRRGATPDQSEACLRQLDEYKLLNDELYAQELTQSLVNQGKGPALIKQSLRRAGIDPLLIAAILEKIPIDSIDLRLAQLAQRYIERRQLGHSPGDRAKIYRFLLSRGYTSAQIRRAIDSIPLF